VGDNLFVTDTTPLKLGIQEQAANSILIKLNQIDILTETLMERSTPSMANPTTYPEGLEIKGEHVPALATIPNSSIPTGPR
jgi:hypothetical protein